MRLVCLFWILFLAAFPAFAQTVAPAKPGATYAKPGDIPVAEFFRRAEYSKMAISPDGSKLAALRPINGRDNLVVIDFQAGKSNVVTGYKDLDVHDFEWISNDRLYFRVADFAEASGEIYLRGAYAIDVDGKNARDLTYPLERVNDRKARQNSVVFQSTNTSFRVLSRTFDGSGDVIAQIFGRSKSYADVYRFNTRTGEHKLLTVKTPGNVVRWLLDRDLVPRIAVRHEERADPTRPREQTIWHRADADALWEKIGSASGNEREGSIVPIAFDYDNKTLYVSSDAGLERRAIFKYDIAARKLGEKLLQHPLIDLSGNLIFSREKRALMGVRYNATVPDVTWFDVDQSRLQAGIDKALPNSTNNVMVADESSRYVLIYSASDINPGGYFLYNTETLKLQEVSKSREWLPPALMSKRTFIKYKTRDGLEIPAWITTPINSDGKNLPLVVHIHGGPWVRGYSGIEWGRWPTAQFLASRGYAVLEPEPRGSTGFGRKHYTSSFKQWGLTMQDDITDGALHLVKEGVVDKGRMCLFGGSYGGYATLQGLVKDPELWRCGAAYVAVTDLELLQTVAWSDTARGSDYLETDFKRRVGDHERDREQFNKTSPAKNADKIKAPVLLAMGSDDQRVPLIHGTTMRDAMEKAGKPIEYVVYSGEGHGFNKDENVNDFYSRIERFLATNLKK
jgi:dipeptidyl aminopeptidase/acylaminoacyl peptidase